MLKRPFHPSIQSSVRPSVRQGPVAVTLKCADLGVFNSVPMATHSTAASRVAIVPRINGKIEVKEERRNDKDAQPAFMRLPANIPTRKCKVFPAQSNDHPRPKLQPIGFAIKDPFILKRRLQLPRLWNIGRRNVQSCSEEA